MAISVLFVLPFFDTQLFWTIVSFSRHNKKKKKKKRKLSFWDDAYAAGVWTIDEPMEKNSKVLLVLRTYGMACDRLCSTLWQQRRWMVLLVAYSLAEAFTGLDESVRFVIFPSLSWLSRSWAENIYSRRAHVYVCIYCVCWRTPILCSPSSFPPSTLLYFHKYNTTRVGWLSSNRRSSRWITRRDAEKNLTIFGDEKSWLTRLVVILTTLIALIVTVQGLYFLSLQ